MEPERQDLWEERSFGEGLVSIAEQKPEALNLTDNTLHDERLQGRLFGQKSRLHETLQLPGSPR